MSNASKPWVDWSPWTVKGDRRVVASERAWRVPTDSVWEFSCGCTGGDSRCPMHKDGERMPRRIRVVPDLFEDWRNGKEDDGAMQCRKTGEDLCVNARGHVWPIGWPSMSDGDDWDVRSYTMNDARRRVFDLIDATPNVDWLVSTACTGSIAAMTPPVPCTTCFGGPCQDVCRECRRPRSNLWLGARLSTQAEADGRIPELLRIPAAKRWLDVSPTEGIRLRDVPGLNKIPTVHVLEGRGPAGVDWVRIAADAHPDAAKSLVEQCRAAGVPCWCEGDEVAREIP